MTDNAELLREIDNYLRWEDELPADDLLKRCRAALSSPVASAQVPREPTNAILKAMASEAIYEMPADRNRLKLIWQAGYDAALAERNANG